MKTLKKLSQLLSSKERFKIVLLLLMILIMALIDLLGIASIMPFIAVLSNPELIETNEALSYAYEIGNNFGIVTKNRFLFALGIIVFLLDYLNWL